MLFIVYNMCFTNGRYHQNIVFDDKDFNMIVYQHAFTRSL